MCHGIMFLTGLLRLLSVLLPYISFRDSLSCAAPKDIGSSAFCVFGVFCDFFFVDQDTPSFLWSGDLTFYLSSDV